jgi:hypothetical protein
MNALASRKITVSLMFAIAFVYLIGGCAGLLLSAFLRAGYGPGVVDHHNASGQGIIWSFLGVFCTAAAWSLLKRWTISLLAARTALIAVLAWEAWVLWQPIRGQTTDYWMDILGVLLAGFALASSLPSRQEAQ